MTRLNFARFFLIIGLVIGLKSLIMTFEHVGDSSYVLISDFTKGATHGWYHAFREGISDVAAIIMFLLIFFGSERFRTPATWILSLIVAFGYYSSFWIGTPFVKELAAPHWKAELVHIGMAFFVLLAIFISKKDFYEKV